MNPEPETELAMGITSAFAGRPMMLTDQEILQELREESQKSTCMPATAAILTSKENVVMWKGHARGLSGHASGFCAIVNDTRRLLPGPGMGGVAWQEAPRCLHHYPVLYQAIAAAQNDLDREATILWTDAEVDPSLAELFRELGITVRAYV